VSITVEELARKVWREELDDEETPDLLAWWYSLPREDRAGLLAEQEHEHTKASQREYCATCGAYLAGGMIARSTTDARLCVECADE
jgi:hypothetical protein